MSEILENTLTTTVAEPPLDTSQPAPDPIQTVASAEPAATPAEPTPEEKRQRQADRRFANLTARSAREKAEREAAERRVADLEARLAALQPQDQQPAPKPVTQADVRAEAERLRAAERFEERRQTLVQDGAATLGEAVWNEKTAVIASLGATENQAFMQTLVELPGPAAARLVAALADDSDGLTALLKKSPVAMAAEMGRMAAKLDTTEATPKPGAAQPPATPKISAAPRPVAPVTGRAVAEPDVYDEKLSMKEFVALRAKQAPPHLGGSRRA